MLTIPNKKSDNVYLISNNDNIRFLIRYMAIIIIVARSSYFPPPGAVFANLRHSGMRAHWDAHRDLVAVKIVAESVAQRAQARL